MRGADCGFARRLILVSFVQEEGVKRLIKYLAILSQLFSIFIYLLQVSSLARVGRYDRRRRRAA